jgi:hypothetical protein
VEASFDGLNEKKSSWMKLQSRKITSPDLFVPSVVSRIVRGALVENVPERQTPFDG